MDGEDVDAKDGMGVQTALLLALNNSLPLSHTLSHKLHTLFLDGWS